MPTWWSDLVSVYVFVGEVRIMIYINMLLNISFFFLIFKDIYDRLHYLLYVRHLNISNLWFAIRQHLKGLLWKVT